MPRVHLVVTERVADLVDLGQREQSQIAMRRPSPEIRERTARATARNSIVLRLGGLVPLVVGDNSAIWRAHQPDPQDFDSLYELLSRHIGREMAFQCELD